VAFNLLSVFGHVVDNGCVFDDLQTVLERKLLLLLVIVSSNGSWFAQLALVYLNVGRGRLLGVDVEPSQDWRFGICVLLNTNQHFLLGQSSFERNSLKLDGSLFCERRRR
jgi:hypothetical protein